MKKIILRSLILLIALSIVPVKAFTDKSSLSYMERAALIAAKWGGACVGSIALGSLGSTYVDGVLESPSELDLNLDLDDDDFGADLDDIDLDGELSSDNDSDDDSSDKDSSDDSSSDEDSSDDEDRSGTAFRSAPELREQVEQFAQQMGISPADAAQAAQAMGADAADVQDFMAQAEDLFRARGIDPTRVAAGVGLGTAAFNADMATQLFERLLRGNFAGTPASRAARAAEARADASAGNSDAPRKTVKDLEDKELIEELQRRQKGSNSELFKDVDDNLLLNELEKRFYEKSRGYSLALKFFSPGKRIGQLSGLVIGWKAGKKIANRMLARRHGVDVETELLCRYYNINISQYKELIVAAQKADVQAMKKAMDIICVQRFGADWKTKLRDALYTFENYAHFVMSKKRKVLSDHHADYARMIELGVALDAIYFGKKPTYENSIGLARGMYLMLGFDAPEVVCEQEQVVECQGVATAEQMNGVSLDIKNVCQVYHVYGDEHVAVLLAAQKRNLIAMRDCLQDQLESKFGADWKQNLNQALYEYDQLATFLVKQRRETLTDAQQKLLSIVELGAALFTVYEGKKPLYAKVVQDARAAYQLLGFNPMFNTEKNNKE